MSLWLARVARQEARKTGQVADFLETMLGGLQPDVAQSNDTKLIRIILTNATTRMDKELAGAPEVAARLKDMVGRTYLAIAEMPPADFYLTQALAMRRKLYPRGHTELASSLHNVASLRRTQGAFEQAEAMQREFLTMLRKTEGDAHPDLATGLNNLGELVQQQPGRLAEATSIFREALARHERRTDEGEHKDLGLAATTGNLAVALHYQGQLAEAEALYRRALQLWQQPSLKGRPAAALPMASLAALLLSQGKAQEAEPLMRQALALQEATLPARHPKIAITLNNLGVLLRNRGDYTEAEAYHRRALDIQRHADNPQKPSIVNALIKLGQTLAAAGKLEEAETLLEEALALQRELGDGGATASAELLKEIQGIRTQQTR